MQKSQKLFQIAEKLKPYISFSSAELDRLSSAAEEVGKAWSNSWFGYHARVYYQGYQKPPPATIFSREWGLLAGGRYSPGNWEVFDFDETVKHIYRLAGDPDLSEIAKNAEAVKSFFEDLKVEALSFLHANVDSESDSFIKRLFEEIDQIEIYTSDQYIASQAPTGQMMSRDVKAIEKGMEKPPHLAVQALVMEIKDPYKSCASLLKTLQRLASHMENLEQKSEVIRRIGTNIFIGHGRSPLWRELKDFISDRLHLPWDEFNNIPVAGITNVTRLSQMLDKAAFAFLVMTGEDEQADDSLHARMNVIHEVGLFQGRLGFDKAIVLLEEGCEEFSNIQGLGQIRFPKGNIAAAFEEIRRVLEHHELVVVSS